MENTGEECEDPRLKFGLAQPTLIQQIKKILDQYPDDGQILKELIQNAEDAEAKEVKFLLDHHSYGTKNLYHPGLAEFQGPALYSYNDAKFTDEDWDGIGMLCDSIKAKDPTKVGRFGLGFKSVFHMTDLPCMISGEFLGILDPSEKFFGNVYMKISGKKWYLSHDSEGNISDQFSPYKSIPIFNCTNESFKRGDYEGTLFRLPLRQKPSALSETVYSREKIQSLFKCFEKDAHLILLFLMNLERIEVYEREEQCLEPRKLFHVGISEHCLSDVRKAREEFKIKKQSNMSALSGGTFPEVKKTYTLTIETVHYDDGVGSKTEHSFVVTLFFSGSDVTQEIKALMTDESLSYLPLVGVALPLQPKMKEEDWREELGVDVDGNYDNKCADAHDEHDYKIAKSTESRMKKRKIRSGNKRKWIKRNEPQGHLFCFLPLPLENKSLTGLPVHVNGFFAVSQNRRHLKWPSTDQDETLTDKSLLWNKGLLQEVLPKAYAELILHVISCLSDEEPRQTMTISDAYSAWPDLNTVDEKWKGILQPLFELLLQSEVLYTEANGGGWCKVEEVLLDNLEKSDQSRDVVIELLNRTGQKVVTVPAHVKTDLEQFRSMRTIKYVNPNLLRTSLKAHPSCYSNLNHQDKILLLKFVLSDSNFTELEGLRLLPLSDMTFTTFRGQGVDPIYIDSTEHPKSLLPRLQRMFLDTELDDAVTERLKKAVEEGHTQLRHLNEEAVKRHLRQTLPSDWLDSEDHVTWHPGETNQPTINWLKALWEYFGRYFAHKASDLDAFIKLPLVIVTPVSNQSEVQLARLQRPSSLILASFNGESIDESVCQVLRAVGLTILKDLPEYIRHYPELVPSYANPASPRGVLNAMGVIKNDLLTRTGELPADKIRLLRTFLSSLSSPTSSEACLLRQLPLFGTYVDYEGTQSRFVSINEVNVAAPVDDLPGVTVFTDLLDLRDGSSRALAQKLNTFPMTLIDLLKTLLDDALRHKYAEREVDMLAKYTLERFGILHGEGLESIKQKLQCLSFVVCSDNSRKKPTELFNPEDDLLRKIFLGEDVFPKESYYSQPEVNAHLKKLGLKGEESITTSDVLNSANMVNNIEDQSEATLKSTAILMHLNKNLYAFKKRHGSEESVLRQLSSIAWVPVITKKPPMYPCTLPLKEGDAGWFACPKDVKSNDFINIVGSVKNLVDIQTNACPELSDYFKWNEKPTVSDVVMHLGHVTSEYNVDEKPRFITVVKDTYSYLAKENSSEVTKVLQGRNISKWAWNGDGFSSPNEVSIESPSINLSPYFSSLPPETKEFNGFFKECGIKDKFNEEDFVSILRQIKKTHDEGKQDLSSCERDLSLAITILNKLRPPNEEPFSKDLRETLLLPVDVVDNTRLQLIPVTECTYCDLEWQKGGYDLSDFDDKEEGEIKLVHRNVPISIVVLLEVPTLMSRFLSAEELEMGECFGQSESLLDRLRGLLDGYTDGLSVPKELIQNADDAGATEVRFLYDERTNEDCMTRLIDEGMKECQGPALWAYNDAVFSDEDFQNIVKLNAATKKEDSRKIGRFGLGFNSVYNLTDVPSFVSRNSIVILDPHTTYLGKGIRDKSKPGIKLRIEEKKLRRLQNQFKPYNEIFGCNLRPGAQQSYNGTLFRFPLRTASQAQKSEIKKLHYNENQVKELLEILFYGAESLLLFTQNVLRVTVYHLRNESTEFPHPIELFCISRSCSKLLNKLQSEVSLSNSVQQLGSEDQEFVKQSSILKASSSFMEKQVNENFTSSRRVLIKSSMILNCQCTLSDKGKQYFNAFAALGETQVFWLVTSCMVSGEALEMASRNKGLLPTAGVAAKLTEVQPGNYVPVPITKLFDHEDHYQDSTSHHNGSVFCFLPLPIHSGLPVHINGCFAVSDNRRYLRERTEEDKTDQGAEWNDVLMREVVCQTYISMLKDMKHLSPSNWYKFHSLWPRCSDLETNCYGMASQFYSSLFLEQLFSDGRTWTNVQNVVFLEPTFRSEEPIGQVAFDVFKTSLEGTNTIAVELPEGILRSFERYELRNVIQKMCYNKERFFTEVFFPAINSIDEGSRGKLVLYALDDTSEVLRELVKSHPCIPSSPLGHQLKYPKELLHPSGKAAELFSIEDGRFPHGDEFTSDERLLTLKRLGMRKDDLQWDEVIERAESVKSLVPYQQALERTTLIIAFINRKLDNNDQVVEDFQNKMHRVQFLPIMKKPENFPFNWKGDDYAPCTFLSAAELYPEAVKYLASGSVPILDETKGGCGPFLPKVKSFLIMTKTVPLGQVKTQMESVIAKAGALDLEYRSKLFDEVKKAFETLYEYFQRSLKTEKDDVVNFLKPLTFILGEKHLFLSSNVAFRSQVDYPPYLSPVLHSYKLRFGELFKSAGVRESFEIIDYIKTLKVVKEKHNKNSVTEELIKVTQVLNLLADAMDKEKVTAGEALEKYGTIFLPDSNGMMKPSTVVCVKDCYWMPDEEGVVYANDDIPIHVCIKLGAKTRRQETLRKHTFGLPFGQKEKLTNRLKRILAGYPCEESIMKELLQNADDAKATKICFIKDLRQHNYERVFEECWKPLQGPALCVYNNAPFTENDIEAIQNLGEGNKGDDPNKTGQYGVGFNAVYHLTDAPTFISQGEEIGEVMCVFDPNLKFAPGADSSNPGVMYKDLPALRKKFPDVFPCYLGEHFPLNKGTMFRFPLRNEEMANESKICKTPTTTEDLDQLLDSFKKEILEVLLFVNNVKEISVCEIDEETGNMTENYSVKASLSEEDEEKRRDFAARVSKIGKRLQREEMSISDVPVHQVSYVLHLEDRKGLNQKWFVVQKIGFENSKKIPGAVIKAFEKGDLGLLPRGGVAALINSSDHHQDTQGKSFCFLPLPINTGLPVHINGHFALDHEARRRLWRDDKGDCRSSWNDALIRQVVAPCYVTLLDEVRRHISLPRDDYGKTYIKGGKTKNVLSNYVDLFPSLDVRQSWMVLCKEIYFQIKTKGICLLPVLRHENRGNKAKRDVVTVEWFPPTGKGRTQAFFDNLEEVSQDDTEDIRNKRKAKKVLRDSLLAVGFNLLYMPMRVYECFKNSNVDVSLISPTEVVSFFGTYNTENQLCNVGCLPLHIKDTQFKKTSNLLSVLEFCKQDSHFLQRLDGLPLLLTEDEILKVFSTSHPVFQSGYFDIFPHSSHSFLHHDVLGSRVYFKAISVFKYFDVEAFASLLPHEVNEEHYKTTSSYVPWNPESKDSPTQIPNKKWIIRIWKFLTQTRHGLVNSLQAWTTKEQLKKELLYVLYPLSNWCLLPVFEDTQQMLAPLGMSDTVIHFHGSNEVDFQTVLQKLFLPQIYCQIFCEEESALEMARQLVASPEDPNAVLIVLYKKLKSNPSCFKHMLKQDCKAVAEYFSKHARDLKINFTEQIKMLPIYPAIHGDYINIYGKEAFVLSKKIPKAEMHIWEHMETSGIAFLEKTTTLEGLYKFLHCVSKDKVEVYCDIIFKRFGEMSEGARLEHMTFVRGVMKTLEARSSEEECQMLKLRKLRRVLSELKFIPSIKDGILTTASSFHDPSNEVYKVMFHNKQWKFPPEPFSGNNWLDFLRKIGMIHGISEEQFRMLAIEVEAEARTNRTETTSSKSETLIRYLLSPENQSIKALETVKEICFIYPNTVEKRLQEIHPQPSSQQYTCFKGSVAKQGKNEFLVWTSSNLLPDKANPMNISGSGSYIAQKLGVFVDPTVDMVVTHCKNVCTALCKTASAANHSESEMEIGFADSSLITEIMTSIYTFLDKNYYSNEHTINELQRIRCIVVDDGRKFVFPNQVVVDINSDQEIRPYLYKIPNNTAPFARLFKGLGTTNTVTSAQYANILKDMHAEFGNQHLHPNEIEQVFKATKGFFETIEKEDHTKTTNISVLFLPAVMKGNLNRVFLRSSTDIFYNDAPHFKERLNGFENLLLVKLEKCGLKASNDDSLVNELPKSIRPRKLTSEVHECLIDKRLTISCYGTAQELQQLLTSSNFCNGLIRLIKQNDKVSSTKMSSEVFTNIRQQLSCIHVYGVPVLKTRLVYNDKTVPESEREVPCFEQKLKDENQEIWKIYVKAEEELQGYISRVAQVVDRITGHMLKTMLVHLPTMLSLNTSQIKSFLDGLGIYEDDAFLESQTTYFPTPGNFIHIEDHHLLVDDFTLFSPGEYVGYELDDPSLRGEEGTPIYIYAIVIEEVIEEGESCSSEPSSKRYKINIGKDKEPIIVDGADLYKFYRPSQANNECLDIEIFSGAQIEKPANLDEVRNEVRRILQEAWKLPEEKRKKIIKRLFLKWHPDKNPGNETFCTEVFKFIQQEIERLEKGEDLAEKLQTRSASKQNYNYTESWYSSCFSQWKKRASSHREERNAWESRASSHREERNEWKSRASSHGEERNTSWSHRKNPQPTEARRWFRQAKEDLNAARSEKANDTFYEWVCFKCHQSAEKALKAAQYSLDADKTSTHSLTALAQELNSSTLQSLASHLECEVGNSMRMRYPDQVRYPNIPHDVYDEKTASRAIEITSKIIREVDSNYIN